MALSKQDLRLTASLLEKAGELFFSMGLWTLSDESKKVVTDANQLCMECAEFSGDDQEENYPTLEDCEPSTVCQILSNKFEMEAGIKEIAENFPIEKPPLNRLVTNNVSQQYGARIEEMFWIATCLESESFNEFMSPIKDSDFEKLLGINVLPESKEQLIELLLDNNKLGYIAEVYLPSYENFIVTKDGKVTAFDFGYIAKIDYIYAETTEELIKEFVLLSESNYQDCLKLDKKDQAS